MTSRAVERLGMTWLLNEWEATGILAAFPEYDTGIDVIAYLKDGISEFRSIPIQMKASTKEGFYTNMKYLRIIDLKIIYLWHVGDSEKAMEAFCLSYPQAEEIIDSQSRSRKDGVYFTQKSERLLSALEPFRVKDWHKALFHRVSLI
jgi:hypothetical protein